MKRLELIQLFTGAGELDGLAGDSLHAQRRATARVAVELRQNRAGDLQRLIEMRGHVHGFLSGGGVEHEQNFLRLHEVTQADELLHERLVNLQPACRVENQNVAIIRFRVIQRFTGDFQDIRFTALHEHRQFKLFAERFELVHGRRAVDVRGDEQRLPALFWSRRASLPLEVVLPEPCNPTIRMQLGLPPRFSAVPPSRDEPPNKSTSSSWMILMICCRAGCSG